MLLALHYQEKELGHVKHGMQQFDGDRAKLQELEVKLYTAESEIHKLNKSIELYNKKVGGVLVRIKILEKLNFCHLVQI